MSDKPSSTREILIEELDSLRHTLTDGPEFQHDIPIANMVNDHPTSLRSDIDNPCPPDQEETNPEALHSVNTKSKPFQSTLDTNSPSNFHQTKGVDHNLNTEPDESSSTNNSIDEN